MYINKKQLSQINHAVNEIKKLATLETCGLNFLDNPDVKQQLRAWTTWFECYAGQIEGALSDKGGIEG